MQSSKGINLKIQVCKSEEIFKFKGKVFLKDGIPKPFLNIVLFYSEYLFKNRTYDTFIK